MIPVFITQHFFILLHCGMEALLFVCVLQQMVSAVCTRKAQVVHVVQQLGRQLGGV